MLYSDFQDWMNARGQDLKLDGLYGPGSQKALEAVFSNKSAAAVTAADIREIAGRLGCSERQMAAAAEVESNGAAFDGQGRPKVLFERHKFSKFTQGKYDITSYSNPKAGGYNESSWTKLGQAAGKDVDQAFKSVSWGKFQVMGFWYPKFGFSSALEMAWTTVQSEAAHYELFEDYIRMAGLEEALKGLSTDPEDCRAFAKGYNGPNYAVNNYHVKLANAMK